MNSAPFEGCQFGELLSTDGTVWQGNFDIDGSSRWRCFERRDALPALTGGTYGVPLWPIDFHCHGVGRFDFTEVPELALDEIEQDLSEEGVHCVLTLYLPEVNFQHFLDLMHTFDAGRRRGAYRNILGLALEGPLLASHGGTPRVGVWSPSRDQWCQLAACGELGLQYIVLSPDVSLGTSATELPLPDRPPSNVEWVVDLLLDVGIRPALGHFSRLDPAASAVAARRVLARGARRARAIPACVSDHLFNDMPLLFTHAWRTPEVRARREAELREMRIDEWSMDNLEQRLGPVPAALIRGACEGALVLCMNFDGEHVDLAICKRVLDLLGMGHLIAMTDRIQSVRLAGRRLRQLHGGTLLYQAEGIVAAGAQSLDRQMANMRSIGIDEAQIWELVGFRPASVLGIKPEVDEQGRPMRMSILPGNGIRMPIDRHSLLVGDS